MEDKTLPGFCQGKCRVGIPHPIRYDSRPFCSISQFLILPVIKFHSCLRGITTGSVYIHQQFSVINRQLRMIFERQIIFIKLITAGTDHFDITVTLPAFFHRLYRGISRCPSDISGSVIMIGCIRRTLLRQSPDIITPGKIISPFGAIAISVTDQHNPGAIYPLPQTDRERIFPIIMEIIITPLEFLGRKTDKPAMSSQRR